MVIYLYLEAGGRIYLQDVKQKEIDMLTACLEKKEGKIKVVKTKFTDLHIEDTIIRAIEIEK